MATTQVKVKELSRRLGLQEQAIIDRAVSLLWHQTQLDEKIEKETDQWEELSNEAWQSIVENKLFKSYSKSDEIYDQI